MGGEERGQMGGEELVAGEGRPTRSRVTAGQEEHPLDAEGNREKRTKRYLHNEWQWVISMKTSISQPGKAARGLL